MKFKMPKFLAPTAFRLMVAAGQIVPIPVVKGFSLLLATVGGDLKNVQRLTTKIKPRTLPLSLQKAIVVESVNNILMAGRHDNGPIPRPKSQQAGAIFDLITQCSWEIARVDFQKILTNLLNPDNDIPQELDVAKMAVQLCQRQTSLSAEDKKNIFAKLCRESGAWVQSGYNSRTRWAYLPDWALEDIYWKWKMDLNADGLVAGTTSKVAVYLSKNTSQCLLQHCVSGAPNKVLKEMLNDMVTAGMLNGCTQLFNRNPLSADLLWAFVEKGMDLNKVLHRRYRGEVQPMLLDEALGAESEENLQAVKDVRLRLAAEQQRSVLVEAVAETRSVSVAPTPASRRKM